MQVVEQFKNGWIDIVGKDEDRKEVLTTCQALMTVPTIMNSDIFKISSHWTEECLSFAIKNKNILYIF